MREPIQPSKTHLVAVIATGAAIGVMAILSTHAAGTTYFVSPTGSDAAAGTQAAPFQTITKAASVAKATDAVQVEAGHYNEQVTIGNRGNIKFTGAGAGKTIIDGQGVRPYGFQGISSNHITIENFEITGAKTAGIQMAGAGNGNNIISNNLIHDISDPNPYNHGIRVAGGAGHIISNNTVYNIGPGQEAKGILIYEIRDSTVKNNTIYLSRKSGIRDDDGLNNTIDSNRSYLNGIGIEANGAAGDTITNNYLYDNVYGINPKHTGDPVTLAFWGATASPLTKIWHNTMYRNNGAAVWLVGPVPVSDMVDVEDNIFMDSGQAEFRDRPAFRGPHFIMDHNLYARDDGKPPKWYTDDSLVLGTLLAVRNQFPNGNGTGQAWEKSGVELSPALGNPNAGDLDYPATSPAAASGFNLGDSYGAQMGARGLGPAMVKWRGYPAVVISASPAKGTSPPSRAVDGDNWSLWTGAGSSGWMIFDLGQPRTISHILQNQYGANDNSNAKGYSIEASSDNVTYKTVTSGTNHDNSGSGNIYRLTQPITARYIRFNMLSTFGSPNVIFNEIRFGELSSSATPVPAINPDLNHDGLINIIDLSILLSKFGTAGSAGDVNGDGVVNIIDLSTLLGHWTR
jgi:hypothetical protein